MFTTRYFASAVTSGQVRLKSGHRWTSPLKHSLSRAGGLRRPLAVPHPFHFVRLARATERYWKPVIRPHLAHNRFGVSCPSPNGTFRAFKETGPKDHLNRRAAIRVGRRYVVKADVQNFYPSVYTHAIAWALHGKATVKANLRKPRKQQQSFPGDVLDTHVRSAQDGQTMGIPIGPDTSWLIGELLMISVEQRLKQGVKRVRAFRYLDDFEIACRTAAEAETAIQILEEALEDLELSLNPRKVDVDALPDGLEASGVDELRRWSFSSHTTRQGTDASAYFDRLAELRTDDPESSATAFGISRLQGVAWHRDVWPRVEMRAATLVLNEPSAIQSFAKLLASARDRGLPIDSQVLGSALNAILERSAPLGRDSEVAWALWLAIEYAVPLESSACKALGHVHDSFGVLLALLAGRRGILGAPPKRDEWRTAMATPELEGERWLLSYEARERGWMRSMGGGDHRSTDPFFSELARAGVSFMNLGAQTEPTFEIAPPSRPGEAGVGSVGYGL